MTYLTIRQDIRSRENNALQACFDSYWLARAVVGHIQQLVHLLADIQRHRACSMAILSGNAGFEQQIHVLRGKINARIACLDTSLELGEVVDPAEWQVVISEWKVVGYGWRKDYLLHNFELHSHLVEKIVSILRTTGRWLTRSGNYSEAIADRHLSHAFFDYLFSHSMLQIEVMGRLRGLGTHVASSGGDEAIVARLDYLTTCAREAYRAYRAFVGTQETALCSNRPALMAFGTLDEAFAQWMVLMQQVKEGEIAPSVQASNAVYAQATRVIDGMLAIHAEAMSCLQQVLDDTFEYILEQYFG